jgi:LTXXQ motif family protein
MLQMKYPSKIASMVVVAVLSVAGLTAVTAAVADSGRWSHSGWNKGGKHHGGKPMCHRGRGGPGGQHGMHRRHGADHLARKLSVMETEIGIRANQIDAWRDFTDALQATMKRPMGPGMAKMSGDSAEPFSLAEGFADNTIARAKSAEDLKAAIDTLRTTLTPEQLEKVKAIEARFRARMARHHGPHGKGPHGSSAGPQDKPDAGADDGPGDDDDDDGDDGDDGDDN